MADYVFVLGTSCEAFHCIVCGVAFTVPAVVVKQHRESGGYHHCPNGHSQGWSKDGSENEKLRRERDRLIQQKARLEDERRDAEQAQARAEAALKRHKKRSAAGTCPCCKRTFANMAAHMKREHPQFVEEAGAKVVPLKRAEA